GAGRVGGGHHGVRRSGRKGSPRSQNRPTTRLTQRRVCQSPRLVTQIEPGDWSMVQPPKRAYRSRKSSHLVAKETTHRSEDDNATYSPKPSRPNTIVKK